MRPERGSRTEEEYLRALREKGRETWPERRARMDEEWRRRQGEVEARAEARVEEMRRQAEAWRRVAVMEMREGQGLELATRVDKNAMLSRWAACIGTVQGDVEEAMQAMAATDDYESQVDVPALHAASVTAWSLASRASQAFHHVLLTAGDSGVEFLSTKPKRKGLFVRKTDAGDVAKQLRLCLAGTVVPGPCFEKGCYLAGTVAGQHFFVLPPKSLPHMGWLVRTGSAEESNTEVVMEDVEVPATKEGASFTLQMAVMSMPASVNLRGGKGKGKGGDDSAELFRPKMPEHVENTNPHQTEEEKNNKLMLKMARHLLL